MKPETTPDQTAQLCNEARQHGFASVSINGVYVKLASDPLRDSGRWGMLDREGIVGKAWISYWPPQERGLVHHYSFLSG